MCVGNNAKARALSWGEFIDAVASPMIVFDRYLDVVAANRLAGAVSAAFRVGTNLGRFTFLNPMEEETAEQWTVEAAHVAAALRHSLKQHDPDQRFREIVGELVAQSESFAALWAAPTGAPDTHGVAVFRNPLVGTMHLAHEHLRRTDGEGHTVMVWAPADRESSERLERLRGLLTADPSAV